MPCSGTQKVLVERIWSGNHSFLTTLNTLRLLGPNFILFFPATLGFAMADAFDLTDLGVEWDQVQTIRERLRQGENLLDVKKSGGDSCINDCIKNSDVLVPMLHRFFTSRLKLPDIGGLRIEIERTYTKSQRSVDESTVDDNAWDLRSMMRLVKRKANRDDPSTVSWIEIVKSKSVELSPYQLT